MGREIECGGCEIECGGCAMASIGVRMKRSIFVGRAGILPGPSDAERCSHRVACRAKRRCPACRDARRCPAGCRTLRAGSPRSPFCRACRVNGASTMPAVPGRIPGTAGWKLAVPDGTRMTRRFCRWLRLRTFLCAREVFCRTSAQTIFSSAPVFASWRLNFSW